MVVPGRLELPTSTLSVWRSNQLSYRTARLKRPARTTGVFPLQPEADAFRRQRAGTNQVLPENCSTPRPSPGGTEATTGTPSWRQPSRAAAGVDRCRPAPERRCSSRTFRYGYLVTT